MHRNKPPGNVVACLGFLLVLCSPTPLSAQTGESKGEQALQQPTDFRTYVQIRDEYQGLKGDGYLNIIVPRFEYAVNSSVALRLETPYATYYPGGPGAERVSGQSDMLARAAWRALQRDGFALFVGSDVIFDTADNAQLGFGKTIVAPLAYAAVDLAHDSVFFPSIQHYFSVAGPASRANVSYTTVKPSLLTRWPNRTYTYLEPQFTIDWERNDKVGLTVELELGKLVTNSTAAWIRPGVGVINQYELFQVYDWNLEVGMRYIF
jgi:hypothetical protein